MNEIKIEKPKGKYIAKFEGDEFDIHNPMKASDFKALRIKHENNENKKGKSSIPNAILQTRFLYERGKEIYIDKIEITKIKNNNSDEVHALRVVGSADYRTRIGDREENFYFIIEKCEASIHIEETEENGDAAFYLVINNKS